MKGLYVEDDISLAHSIIESLKDKSVDVDWTRSVKDSIELISKKRFQFFIIDIGLIDGEGFEIAKFIKEKNIQAPILFLTARSGAEDRLKGYELGATEFIPKPFLFAELWLRLEHVLEEHGDQDQIELKDLVIHTRSFLLKWASGETQNLTEKEMRVLELLIQKSPEVVRRSEILDRAWGESKFPSERTIDNIILKLRAYLKHHGDSIKSIRGVGYAWRED